jgi:hypothetical protein
MAFDWTSFWDPADPAQKLFSQDNMNYSMLGIGPKADFPAADARFKKALAWASDEQKLYYCTGAAWTAIAPGLNIAQTIAGVQTFGSIPVLPASDPTTDNQATRKSYVDDRDKLPLTTGIDTVWVAAAVAATTEEDRLAVITGRGGALISITGDSYDSNQSVNIYVDGTNVGTYLSNTATLVSATFMVSLRVTVKNNAEVSRDCSGGYVRGNKG